MATSALVSVDEYLRTVYRPDRDYVEGEVRERNLGEFDHSTVQREIMLLLCSKYPAMRPRVLPEQRVQVKSNRFRIPDVCVLNEGAPREAIIRMAPMLCVEILSRDRMSDMLERVKDYLDMGVPICWIIDPAARAGWTATPGHLAEATDGMLRAGNVEMRLAEALPEEPGEFTRP